VRDPIYDSARLKLSVKAHTRHRNYVQYVYNNKKGIGKWERGRKREYFSEWWHNNLNGFDFYVAGKATTTWATTIASLWLTATWGVGNRNPFKNAATAVVENKSPSLSNGKCKLAEWEEEEEEEAVMNRYTVSRFHIPPRWCNPTRPPVVPVLGFLKSLFFS